MADIIVFKAKKIITMDPNRPEATHVAVKEGKILAVGGADCAAQWGEYETDTSLSDSVLMPGFVEGHAHMMAGAMWQYAYAGYHDRTDPDGKLWKGMTTIEEVVASLKSYVAKLAPGEPLVGWGFDPIFLPTERLNRRHLDEIAGDRPVVIMFSSFHVMCVNSAALEMAGYDEDTEVEGVLTDGNGSPTGELQEMAAMFPVMHRVGFDFKKLSQEEASIRSYGKTANRAGVTTITDLFATITPESLETLLSVTGDADFPVRIVPTIGAMGAPADQIAAQANELAASSTDKLRLGGVKLMTDGSIQGWTARVKWPGYVGGQPNGIWNTAPEQIYELCEVMQREHVKMNIHTNGDEASEVVIDAIDAAMRKHPWTGARHVLQHAQMMGVDQFERAAELGICVNLFANHIWYFGDQHAALTIGEDRAMRMDACRSAANAGVHFTIHSDAPVTPLGPLFTAWCAVNRTTMSGRTLGGAQCLTVMEGLHAITLGAAYTMGLDDEIGSIETGKQADFAVLGADPTAVDPAALKNVPVLGTVLGGRVNLL
jgi:hypothetical protein